MMIGNDRDSFLAVHHSCRSTWIAVQVVTRADQLGMERVEQHDADQCSAAGGAVAVCFRRLLKDRNCFLGSRSKPGRRQTQDWGWA